MAPYFIMVNDQAGVNEINFISYHDGQSPSKTVEMTRELFERDPVLFFPGALGASTNSAISSCMNEKERRNQMGQPQRPSLNDGIFHQLRGGGGIYGTYILKNKPDGKIGGQSREPTI